jgi:CRP-like cAMP-binding protein
VERDAATRNPKRTKALRFREAVRTVPEKENRMKQSPFTADDELIQALKKRSQPIFCSEDCVLFCQGDPASGLYILRSGTAILTLKSDSGRVAMCFEAFAGSLLGLPAILGNVPYSLAAIARQGSIVRYVTRDDFEDLIRVQPSLEIMVLQVVQAEVVATRKALSEMRLRIETQIPVQPVTVS